MGQWSSIIGHLSSGIVRGGALGGGFWADRRGMSGDKPVIAGMVTELFCHDPAFQETPWFELDFARGDGCPADWGSAYHLLCHAFSGG
jgi:hypothetical protein